MANTLTVGDLTLEEDNGRVRVTTEDGEENGYVTAQGIQEAAEIDGDALSELWEQQQE